MTAAAHGLVRVGTESDFGEVFAVQVEAPEVVQLNVVVTHATEDVCFVIEDTGRLTSTDAGLLVRLLGDLFPLEGVAVLTGHVCLIDTRTVNEATEDEEGLIINHGQRVVVTALGHITRLLEHGPSILVRVKLEGGGLSIADASKDNNLVAEDSWLVMADSRGDRASLLNLLPANAILRVVLELVDSIDAETPHVVHGANFNVAPTVDIKVVVHNKGAVVRAPLGESARHTNFGPVVWLVGAYLQLVLASALGNLLFGLPFIGRI